MPLSPQAFPDSAPRLDCTLRSMAAMLAGAGVDSPRLSAEVLLAQALNTSRDELLKLLLLQPDRLLSPSETAKAGEYTRRRAQGEPVAYITGEKEFYGRPFMVNPEVLIPRPETELLIDLALELVKEHPFSPLRFADFGAGSGCIAITLTLELPYSSGLAIDISPAALLTAAANAKTLRAERLTFALADFNSPPLADNSLDLLVSNPPYISEREYGGLSNEVRCFEPKGALVPAANTPGCPQGGNASGLESALSVITEASRTLKPGGTLLLEMGCGQGQALLRSLDQGAWCESFVHRDLAGLDRVLIAKKKAD